MKSFVRPKLIEKFGNKGFDYIGNSISDLEIWKVSKKAITFNASNSLKLRLEKTFEKVVIILFATICQKFKILLTPTLLNLDPRLRL